MIGYANSMKTSIIPNRFISNFFRCGITGWCLEILFTALGALRRREMQLVGHTSLWMFPIYGCAALFQPLFWLIRKCSVIVCLVHLCRRISQREVSMRVLPLPVELQPP